ncbi:ankyrin repeat domain-containing protein [Candidatus Babeliales bacterium]|nr:ankyrin repeat domain-containing protein [Candidatus Babeliales bacterium]
MNIIFLFLMAMSTIMSVKSHAASLITKKMMDICQYESSDVIDTHSFVYTENVGEKYIEIIYHLFSEVDHALKSSLLESPKSLALLEELLRAAKKEFEKPDTKTILFYPYFGLFVFNEILNTYPELLTYTNRHGETLLHITAKTNLPKFAQSLLKRDSNINTQDNYGKTPLHAATKAASIETIEILLGSNKKIYDTIATNGHTALDFAIIYFQLFTRLQSTNVFRTERYQKIMMLLKEKGYSFQEVQCIATIKKEINSRIEKYKASLQQNTPLIIN